MPSNTRSKHAEEFPEIDDPESLLTQPKRSGGYLSKNDDFDLNDDIQPATAPDEQNNTLLKIKQLELEIRKMQLEKDIGQARDAKGTETIKVDDFITDWIDPESRTGKQISAFQERAKQISRGPILNDGKDWRQWKDHMINHAKQAGVERLLMNGGSPTTESRKAIWKACNQWLYNHLWNHISHRGKHHFTQPPGMVAADLWQILHATFAERTQTTRCRLMKEMRDLRVTREIGGNRGFIERIMAIRHDFEQLKCPLPDYAYFDIVMIGVSRHWKEILQTKLDATEDGFEQPDGDFPGTMRELLSRMPLHGESDHSDSYQKSFHTKKTESDEKPNAETPRPHVRGRHEKSTSSTCTYCHKSGHTDSRCFKKHPELAPTRRHNETKNDADVSSDVEVSKAYNVTPSNARSQNEWVLDSGSGTHATPQSLDDSSSEATVLRMANGGLSHATSTGLKRLTLDNATINLRSTHHVPNLETNLVSLGQLVRDGWTFRQFSSEGFEGICLESADKTMSFEAILNDDNIYVIRPNTGYPIYAVCNDEVRPASEGVVMVQSQRYDGPNPRTDTMDNWHRRWAHLSARSILKLAADPRLGIKIKGPKEITFCETCQKVKQTTKPFSPATRTTQPGSRIFFDIVGGGTTLGTEEIVSLGGSKYTLIATDDATRYRWLFLLRDRSQARIVIPWLVKHIDSSTGRKVAFLHADGAKEFTSKELTDFFDSRGIKFENTIPYTSQQNGTAERANRTIMERTRSLLFDSGLPQHLWGEAAVAAIIITNTAPTSTKLYGCRREREPLTPFEAWTGLQSDCNWLIKWGSDAWEHHKTNSKLAERSRKFKLVGWEGTHIFRLWDPENNTIHRARDVVFNEHLQATPAMAMEKMSAEAPILDVIDPLTWECPIAYHMKRHFPEKVKDLANGDFDSIPESSLMMNEQRVISNDAQEDESEDNIISEENDIPETLMDAKRSKDWHHWDRAMKEEIAKLEAMGTYTIVEKPKTTDARILTGKWVFDRKRDNKGRTLRFRARWVVRGCLQRQGIHYDATYAAVVNGVTTRAMIALTAARQYKVIVIDYISAFLNGKLPADHALYMTLPAGHKHARGDKNMVAFLRQSLYGLKQAARVWYFTVTDHLKEIGFLVSKYDAGLFFHQHRRIWITLHVDDSRIIAEHQHDAEWAKSQIASRFEIRDITTCTRYLGMEIKETDENICISQGRYIEEILNEFNMTECKPATTPMETGLKIDTSVTATTDDSKDKSLATNYRKCIGCLQYLVTTTRPDITFAVNYLSRFNSCPNNQAWQALKRILRYLRRTRNDGIAYPKRQSEDLTPVAYSDSDWAGSDPTFKSTSGYVIFMNGAPVSWRSMRQNSVSKSTTEAEYIAASETACELLWLKDMLEDAKLTEPSSSRLNTSQLFVDNRAAIDLAHSEAINRRSRHIEVRHHILRDWVQKGEINLEYVPTEANKADGFTKPLSKDLFQKYVDRICTRPS